MHQLRHSLTRVIRACRSPVASCWIEIKPSSSPWLQDPTLSGRSLSNLSSYISSFPHDILASCTFLPFLSSALPWKTLLRDRLLPAIKVSAATMSWMRSPARCIPSSHQPFPRKAISFQEVLITRVIWLMDCFLGPWLPLPPELVCGPRVPQGEGLALSSHSVTTAESYCVEGHAYVDQRVYGQACRHSSAQLQHIPSARPGRSLHVLCTLVCGEQLP